MLFTIVYSCSNNWSHFKSHVASEISANEIINGKVTALEPSSRFVHCLHSGLLNSHLSPVVESSPLFVLGITRQCFEDRFSTKMPHYIDLKKRGLPGFDFLYAARKSIDRHLKAHKLHVSTEPLFQNLVVHSINHYLFYQYNGGNCGFSLDGSETFMSYIRSFLFIEFWSTPKINPFDDVRFCALAKSSGTHQFYVDVYQDLVKVDRVLADHVIASTCF
jgi:hypothetical protein